MESKKDMDLMGMITGKKKLNAAERNFENKNKWMEKENKREEEQAIHKGRLKYLERQAAKGQASSGGIAGSAGKGLLTMFENAASNTFGDSGGGRRRRGGGGGPFWDPVGGESVIGASRRHSSRHRPRHKKTMTRYRRKEVFYY